MAPKLTKIYACFRYKIIWKRGYKFLEFAYFYLRKMILHIIFSKLVDFQIPYFDTNII